jgi:glycosyltransferase involved in cell wall biosynthesis
MPSIAIICPYPFDTVAGQRFRYEQYLDYLEKNGCNYVIYPFLDAKTNNILYQPKQYGTKVWGVLKGFLGRIKLLFHLHRYDYLFIYREASPIGPPIFEWLFTKVFRKKILIDYDDAIWLTKTASSSKALGLLRNHAKLSKICSWSYKVVCGNTFLADYAKQYSNNVTVIPTTIDLVNRHNLTKQHQAKKTTIIGWTGSRTTMIYLPMLYPIIAQLAKQYPLEFHIISDQAPSETYPFIRYIPWNKKNEIDALIHFDIGVMPLHDTIWEQGKCGFKALQYMALGIPAIVSPVGVNSTIITDKKDGFLAHNAEEWYDLLEKLLLDPSLRQKTGQAAQTTIQQYYSVKSQEKNYLALFS